MVMPYSLDFYSDQRAGSQKSANVVLPLVMNLIKPKSIADIGCGVGTWLATAALLNSEAVLLGFEGEWLQNVPRVLDDLVIKFCNLEQKIIPPDGMPAKYDLAMCLEVAEHLSKERGPTLVNDICALSDVVLFGAAIPGQGGTEHTNEQWQGYWAALFAANGYKTYDVVRPAVWDNSEVKPWYRQNALLYVHDRAAHLVKDYRECTMLSLVHPEVFAYSNPPGPSYLIRKFPGSVKRAISNRLLP
jgi:hypothetical protein